MTLVRFICIRCLAAALALAALALAVPAAAQTDTCTTYRFPVGVFERNGQSVAGLSAANLGVKAGRTNAHVVSIKPAPHPPRIVILLDASGSMLNDREKLVWETSVRAVQDLLERVPRENEIGMIAFTSDPVMTFDLKAGREAIRRRLPDLKRREEGLPRTDRKTGIYRAIVNGLWMLEEPRPGDVLYLISDGTDTVSHRKTQEELQKLLPRYGVRLFAMALAPVFDLAPGWRGRLAEMVRDSGGSAFAVFGGDPRRVPEFHIHASDEGQLRAEWDRLYQNMLSFYEVEIELALPLKKPTRWSLEVFDGRNRRRRNTELLYPRMLAPCAPSTP